MKLPVFYPIKICATLKSKYYSYHTLNVSYFILICAVLPYFSKAQSDYFPPLTGDAWETISPQTLNWNTSKIEPLLDFLEAENSRAFLVLHEGKIVMEHYFNGFGPNESWYWASAGKSLTAFAVGMAVEQQKLSIQDPIKNYLGSWTSCDPSDEEQITVWNALTMTSGFDTDIPNLDCTADTCFQCKYLPGSRWFYHNASYTVLDGVLENATGLGLNVFLQRNLFRFTGMSGAFVRVGDNNVFWSKARSMARFGLLVQRRGFWGEQEVLGDDSFFNAMISPSQTLNPSYGYLWWLNGQSAYKLPGVDMSIPGQLMKDAPADVIAALGKNGQIINVVPSLDLVLIRMGESSNDFPIGHLLNNKIWQYMNDILPTGTSTFDDKNPETALKVYPNPGNGLFSLKLPFEVEDICMVDAVGRFVGQVDIKNNIASITLEQQPTGLYILRVMSKQGKVFNVKIINKL